MIESILSGIFLVLIGIGCIWAGNKMSGWRKITSEWTKTNAKLISKHIGEKKILPGTSQSNYRIYVEYEFTVNGTTFVGNTLNLVELQNGEEAMLMKTAERLIQKIGSTITIYYNPANPNQSVVYRGGYIFWIFLLMLGIGMILIGGLVLMMQFL